MHRNTRGTPSLAKLPGDPAGTLEQVVSKSDPQGHPKLYPLCAAQISRSAKIKPAVELIGALGERLKKQVSLHQNLRRSNKYPYLTL
jgi:hypothetical protein